MARAIRVYYKNRVIVDGKPVWGYSDGQKVVLDRSLKGLKHLEILDHEMIHHIFPHLSEEEVERISIILTKTLWAQGYRRPDNSNDIPLQDGSR